MLGFFQKDHNNYCVLGTQDFTGSEHLVPYIIFLSCNLDMVLHQWGDWKIIVANSCQEFRMKAFEIPFISKIALSTTGRL